MSDHLSGPLRRRAALAGGGALVIGGVTPASLLASAEIAGAATIEVTRADDSATEPEPGSLRMAILEAENGDTITFAPDVDEIVLRAEIEISKSITIEGPGVTITGGEDIRHFRIDAENLDVTISGVTLSDGQTEGYAQYGGSVLCSFEASSDLTLQNVTFSGNSSSRGGAAVSWDGCGDLSVVSSSFSGNVLSYPASSGGAIRFTGSGKLSISDSSFEGNEADAVGGAIFVASDVTDVEISGSVFVSNSVQFSGGALTLGSATYLVIRDSQFAQNTAGNSGGAISVSPVGEYGAGLISGSTFTDNTAASGGAVNAKLYGYQTWTMVNSTVSGNQAADTALRLYAESGNVVAAVVMSTITDSVDSVGDGVPGIDVSGAVAAGIAGSVVSGNGDVDVDASGDLLEVDMSVVGSVRVDGESVDVADLGAGNAVTDDPQVGPLADNGGFSLPGDAVLLTRLPGAGSPASGLVPSGSIEELETEFGVDLGFDQRGAGFARVVDGASDAGAVTLQAVPPVPPVPGVVGFVPVEPERLLDSRGSSPVSAGSVTEVKVAGRAGVPESARFALVNVTAVDASAAGFLTVYGCGELPGTSNLNVAAGGTRANSVLVELDDAGSLCVFSSMETELLVDVLGWFDGGFVPSVPERLLDTRASSPVAAGSVTRVQLTGAPDSATSAVVNVTAVEASAAGFLTVFGCGEQPGTSNVNVAAGGTVANLVVVDLDADGGLCVFSSVETELLVDMFGWFESGFSATGPMRLVDTRESSPWTAGSTNRVQVTGVPASARSVVVNVTAVEASAAGFASVVPCDGAVSTSNLNVSAGETAANLVMVGLDDDGGFCVFTSAESDYLVDVFGWFDTALTDT